mmetsp:Transcript_46523/g.56329  ORF Transcript_46523/g.56329 Transcript_46523/m.56329 type:complete len:109 (-) Transcript_46523:277-603(-)
MADCEHQEEVVKNFPDNHPSRLIPILLHNMSWLMTCITLYMLHVLKLSLAIALKMVKPCQSFLKNVLFIVHVDSNIVQVSSKLLLKSLSSNILTAVDANPVLKRIQQE